MITVEVDKADLRRVYSALGKIGNDAPKVICRGINKTASSSKTQLSDRARAVYTVKSGKFKGNMNIHKATYSQLEAEVQAKGKPLSITSFKTTAPKSKHCKREWTEGIEHGRHQSIQRRGKAEWTDLPEKKQSQVSTQEIELKLGAGHDRK